jgi:hypothetical protein
MPADVITHARRQGGGPSDGGAHLQRGYCPKRPTPRRSPALIQYRFASGACFPPGRLAVFGGRAFIAEAHRIRKLPGGGPPAGIIAAVGIVGPE